MSTTLSAIRKNLSEKTYCVHPVVFFQRKIDLMGQSEQDKFLDDILHEAEKEGPHLFPPTLPKQRLPPYVRMILKLSYLPIMLLDLAMQSLAKKIIRPPFKKEGACKKRGNCCRFILLPAPTGFIGKLYFLWQTEVNGFYVKQTSPTGEDGGKILALGCRHLSDSGRCMSYKTRPAVCRRWPVIEVFGRPQILKGCGYRASPRSVKNRL